MSEDNAFEFNSKALQKMLKTLKDVPHVKVGILGDKNARRDGKETNASIGAKHEFGEDGLPMRSFLRVPITQHMQSYLEESGLFDKKSTEKILASGDLTSFVAKIGIVAENIVADAFDTGGFGRWQPSNMKFKTNAQTLVETQQLRNSISSEVVK